MTVYKVIRFTERPVVGMIVFLKTVDIKNSKEIELWLGDTLETTNEFKHSRGGKKIDS